MGYRMVLTEADCATLSWLEERGYDCGLYDALEPIEGEAYEIPEHKTWAIRDASECPDSGFACLDWSSRLGKQIAKFLERIV